LILSIPSLFDQGNGNVAKETEVKSLGVKGVKELKDGGMEESYVSADKCAHIFTLSYVISYWFYQSLLSALCNQGDGNVAKETEFMPLGVKGVKDSKDGGIKGSYVSADKCAHIVTVDLVPCPVALVDYPVFVVVRAAGRGKRCRALADKFAIIILSVISHLLFNHFSLLSG
jgi:hypothetical protein